MSWAIGYDDNWKRDIGYGVPAYCDYPGCGKKIDRGLAHVCGGEPYGGDNGCGLFFCRKHLHQSAVAPQLCVRCLTKQLSFDPSPDHPDWVEHKLNHESWQQWREENPEEVVKMRRDLDARDKGI